MHCAILSDAIVAWVSFTPTDVEVSKLLQVVGDGSCPQTGNVVVNFSK